MSFCWRLLLPGLFLLGCLLAGCRSAGYEYVDDRSAPSSFVSTPSYDSNGAAGHSRYSAQTAREPVPLHGTGSPVPPPEAAAPPRPRSPGAHLPGYESPGVQFEGDSAGGPELRSGPAGYLERRSNPRRARAEEAVREPVPLAAPPRLLPIPGSRELGDASRGLAIQRVALSSEVRGFDDLTELDARRVRPGQDALVYVALANYRSVRTRNGFRTETNSLLEVYSRGGSLVARLPLGEAVDLVAAPRGCYYLTHMVTIPRDLTPGEYSFSIVVKDLNAGQAVAAAIPVRIRG